jgi:hypothetical protein
MYPVGGPLEFEHGRFLPLGQQAVAGEHKADQAHRKKQHGHRQQHEKHQPLPQASRLEPKISFLKGIGRVLGGHRLSFHTTGSIMPPAVLAADHGSFGQALAPGGRCHRVSARGGKRRPGHAPTGPRFAAWQRLST